MKIWIALAIVGLPLKNAYSEETQTVVTFNAICDEHENLVENLRKYREGGAAIGIAKTALMEVFASRNGSWSLVITGKNGLSCVILAGDRFFIVKNLRSFDIKALSIP